MNHPSSHLVLGPLPQSTYNQQPGQHPSNRFRGSQQQQQRPLDTTTTLNSSQSNSHQPRPFYNKVKKDKNPANMSNYETNPVGALQERFQSRGITPQYRVVQAEGASHAPTFAFQVILGDLTATGTGSSKKQAKHAAARAMLDKLDGRVPAQDGQAPLPPVTDAANGPDAPGNTVGALQELCVKKGYPMPTYDLGAVGGQPHQRNFSIVCVVGKLREAGAGGSKKDAKREAAQKMIDKLKSMGPGGALVSDVVSAEDEELMNKMANVKIETLNSDASQKVAGFYRKLQSANGSKLVHLHRTSLKNRTSDYVTVLGDLGKEQKFEVTYVEVDEKTDDDQVQCLVQLSTLPVAVCYGTGTDAKVAHNDAARNALNYLKMMTKRSAGGSGVKK